MIAPTLTAFVGSVSISWMLWKFLSKRSSLAKHERAAQVIRSPRDTFIPFIALKDHSTLAYPPNALPGARDVSTTYGTMRVYEWGPANGEKVLLIHGDTTPAPVMKPIATGLVDMGRRVMVFDLWGRGYSDTPLHVPHDARLYVQQIFFAINSSELAWTGVAAGGFSLIGFSLGGAIAMCFTAHFPYLVNSLVLLGPGGILRRLPPEYTIIPFRFPSLFPRQHLANLVGKLLGVKTNRRFNPTSDKGIQEADITSAPSGHNPKPEQDSTPDLPNIVQWQYDHHQGFLHSFIDTTQHGPLMHQHKDWEKVGKIIRGDMSEDAEVGKVYKLYNSKILLIVGDQDTIVVGSEIAEDLKEVLGSTEHMLLATVPGTHSFPVPSSKHVLGHIRNFWGLGKDE